MATDEEKIIAAVDYANEIADVAREMIAALRPHMPPETQAALTGLENRLGQAWRECVEVFGFDRLHTG